MSVVRYLVGDLEAAIAFYTAQLGFTLEQQMGPAFAIVALGDLSLWLSSPITSAAQPMPDGRRPEPGGWNRIVVAVDDLAETVGRLAGAGAAFRNEIVSGPGGAQILLDDPDGNPIELFQGR